MLCLLDIETQSECDLSHCGGRVYAAHPSTRILCVVGLIENHFHVWVNTDTWKSIHCPWPAGFPKRDYTVHLSDTVPSVFLGCDTLVAHNADNFDALVWAEKVSRKPVEWIDTAHRARAAGLRGSLDALGKHYLNVGKDEVGKRILGKCMKLENGKNKHTLPGNVGLIASYCIADVLILEEIYAKLPEVSDFDGPVLRYSRVINNRGVAFDSVLARKIIDWSKEAAEEAKEEIKGIIGKEVNLRSVPQMTEWLKSRGTALPNLRKETVERLLNDDDELECSDPVVHRVLELRKSCLRITGSKLSGALASVCSDGRVRDSFTYCGAHTGRWSGRRVQLQNLPRPVPGVDVLGILGGTETDVSESRRLGVPRSAIHSTLIRPCFMAAKGKSLLISDFNAIECRATAWLCEQENLLDTFHSHGDPYLVAASRIFGRNITKADKAERFVGKETVLGSGFGMSAKRFADYMKQKGVDLASAGVTAEQCINAFRETYPRIVDTWWTLDRAAKVVLLTGAPCTIAQCRMYRGPDGFCIELPSGRALTYRGARIEKRVPKWGGDPIDQFVYASVRGESVMFGGKFLENIAQAVSRDLLAAAVVKCERNALPVVIHVHDELVCEHEDAGQLRTLERYMKDAPDWAAGFPIGVESHVSPRYTKEAL